MNEFKSRFGFHPCDYMVYSKLKELHKAYYKALKEFHRWVRWDRKMPKNRIGPEPEYNSFFIIDTPWLRYTRGLGGARIGKWFPKTLTDHGIIELYQKARKPSKTPVEHFSYETLEKINKLYADYQNTRQLKLAV